MLISRISKITHLCLSQLYSQFLYFLSELPDDASVGVLINNSMVNNVLGSVGIAQRR